MVAGARRKSKTTRAAVPTFDVATQVRRGAVGDFEILHDVADAVDAILEGHTYKSELRTRTGAVVISALCDG